jgi:DNA-directed RNA polymerase specialized sigma24 family protein
MTHDEFNEVYYPKYNSVIRAIARKLANTNDTLAEDLYQEGLLALWLCNPKGAQRNKDAYIRQAVKFRMIDYLRKEKLMSQESLDYHLESGRQIIRGADGATRIVRYRDKSRCGNPAQGEYAQDDDEEEWS